MVTSIRNRGSSFRPSLSASESMGQRGGYLTLRKGAIELSPFYSRKSQSAHLQSDSAGNVWVTSIKKDGLHRTATEIDQRHQVKELVAGSKMSFKGRWLTLETGHLYYHLDKPMIPTQQPYNLFYFKGKENQNSWFSYTTTARGLLFFGEIALDDFSHPAFWNGMVWEATPGMTLALGHRSFPAQYQAPLAGPLSESSSFAGEQGFYVGLEWQLPHRWVVAAYFDRYRFNWLKYQINGPSKGLDWHFQIQKELSNGQSLMGRYRHREKPGNTPVESIEMGLESITHDQVKVQYLYKPEGNWQTTAQAQWHYVDTQTEHYRGIMLACDLRVTAFQERMTLTSRYALFDANNYLASLYAYEPDVLYKFSVPAYSGKGSRYLLLLNYKLTPWWHLWARITRWVYSDREESGTGYNLIPTNSKTEITFQMRLKF